jgi:ribulose-5-phosphate 4-epimerase/fuculose-1-phosphate aldolase
MGEAAADLVMNQGSTVTMNTVLEDVAAERLKRKQRLAASLRIFGKFGFDEGVAGHITVRDPEHTDHFWVNPMGRSFKQMRVSDLLKVDHAGNVVEGEGLLNGAAFAIHSRIHMNHPEITAAAHAHSVYGKSWSSLGRKLDPLTQDSCAFYGSHTVFEDFTGVVLDVSEGDRIAKALGDNKAVILQNHGLLTVGESVDEACWWFVAISTAEQVGSTLAGWFSFQPLYDVIVAEQPDLLD